jgi:hypothetical protein
VNSVDGPLKIRLAWALPLDTGRGNQVEPVTGYRLVLVNGSTNGSDSVIFEGTCVGAACTAVAVFSAPNRFFHTFSITSKNQLEYGGPAALAQNQSIMTPSAPLNVTARVTAPQSIIIRWTMPTNTGVGDTTRVLLSYMVERCFGLADMSCTQSCGCSQSLYTCSDTVGDLCNHTGLTALTFSDTFRAVTSGPVRFYFRVRAQNDAGFGDPSTVVSEQSITVPASPTSLAFTNPLPLTVNLTWALPLNTGTGAVCASDCRPLTAIMVTCVTPTGANCANRTLLANSTSLVVGPLSKLLKYNFSFYAFNDAGSSLPSALALVKSVDLPTSPTLFTTSPLLNTPLVILITWSLPSDTGQGDQAEKILLYQLEFDASGSTFAVGNTIIACGSGTSCSAPYACSCGLYNATVAMPAARYAPYYFRILAKNIVGSGPYANASSQSVGLASEPLNLTVLVVGVKTIQLVWVIPTNCGVGSGFPHALLNYVVQRSYSDSSFAGCTYGTTATDDCSASTVGACCTKQVQGQITTFIANVPSVGPSFFFFRIIAQNEAGLGSASTAGREQGVAVPSAPQSLDVSTIGPARFRAQWGNVADTGVGGTARPLLYYRLEICQGPVYDFSILYFAQNFSTATFTYDTVQLFGGRNYSFRVVAYNDAGRGAPTPVVIQLAVALPSSPRQFSAVVQLPLQIQLSWFIPADTGYIKCLIYTRPRLSRDLKIIWQAS